MQISKLPRSTFYYYLKQSKKDKYSAEKIEIKELFEQNKERYGYRRITSSLRQKGIVLNHKTVLKLMKSLNLKGKQYKTKYHSYKGEVGKIADNLLNRDFSASKPFEKLTTDVTQFNVCDDKVYLSPVMDLYNREIISYSISLSPNLEQIREMLQGLAEKQTMLHLSSIQIKAGNTNTPNTKGICRNTILFRVCPAKETVWITELWKTSSED